MVTHSFFKRFTTLRFVISQVKVNWEQIQHKAKVTMTKHKHMSFAFHILSSSGNYFFWQVNFTSVVSLIAALIEKAEQHSIENHKNAVAKL